MENLITDHIETWTTARVQKASGGRGRGKKANGLGQYGIKKLRELILDLAVRGKLVPQDPKDEPVRNLLQKTAQELSNNQQLKVINPRTALFDVPVGWTWERFGNIAEIERGGSPRPIKSFLTEDADGLNWIKIGDTEQGGKYITSTHERIRREGLSKTRMVYPGDFLLTNSMSFGRPYITKIEGCIHDGWLRISPPSIIQKDYLYRLLSSAFVFGQFQAAAAGAVVMNLNADKVRELAIPIPPLSEQHRIVDKVDELMALCDQLEQEQTDNSETHQLLVKTLLDTLTNATDHADFIITWKLIEQNFDLLFTTPESIDDLKQTILQLAVMGKLVPQDPNDEPASVLLEKIANEKTRLVKEGKIKKQKPLPEISEDERPFELPAGWLRVSFAEIAQEVSTGPFGTMIHKHEYIQDGVPLVNPSHMVDGSILVDHAISVSEKKAKELSSYKLFAGDIVMARRGEVGRSALVSETEDGWLCGTGSFRVKFHSEISRAYILLLFSTSKVREYLQGESVGATMTNLNHTILSKLPLILPPSKEQISIVTKVDELLTLCDLLKVELNDAQITQVQLADATIGFLTA